MKNKKLTYILIPVVLGVWGTIIYRIFYTVNTGNSDFTINKSIIEGKMQSETVSDTFSIYARYSDPFFRKKMSIVSQGQAQVKSVNSISVKTPVKKELPPPSVIKWPEIVYNGLVKNQKSNKQLAMVQVNGQSSIIQTGDMVSDLQLVKVTKDSIEVQFHSERKTIKKQS